jgi:hypothetical protein
MTKGTGWLDVQTSEEIVEVRGHLSRTEWEFVYLAARKMALSHGLSVARFELQSAELDEQQDAAGPTHSPQPVAGTKTEAQD